MGDDKHTLKRLTKAMDCLATHPGDARERVTAAFMILGPLLEDDLPPQCRQDWNLIVRAATKFEPLYNGTGALFGAASSTQWAGFERRRDPRSQKGLPICTSRSAGTSATSSSGRNI